MSPIESLRLAFWALVSNKLRTILTLLGIVIGVGAVIAVMAIGKGTNQSIEDQITRVGTNLIFVRPQAQTNQGVRGQVGTGQTLTLQDAYALEDQYLAPDVHSVAPEVNTFAQARASNQNVFARVTGTTPSYEGIRDATLADGRFIEDQDVTSRSLVAVLGSNISQTLYGDISPVGQFIIINNRQFQIIGVLKAKGGTGQGVTDDFIIAPITTVQTRLISQRTAQGTESVQNINVKAVSNKTIEAAKAQVTDILRERHKITTTDDFLLTSQEDLIQARQEVNDVLTVFLGAIAGISLLVGGIGIMNIMLVSVTERTREIGIRKAVGAKRRDILSQFLTEATLVSFGGGGIGVAAGWGASKLLENLTLNNQPIETIFTANIAGLAVGVSVAIGLFFGIYPALRASRMDPIEALRHT